MNLLPATQRAMTIPLLPALARSSIELDHVYCCRAEDLLTTLPDNYIDLIVTSPPYGTLRTYKGFAWDFETIARQSYRVLKLGGVLVWVVGDQTINGSETLVPFEQALRFRDVGFRVHDTMIYQKDCSFPETNRYYPVFDYMFVCSKGKPATANLITVPNKYAGTKITKTQRRPDGELEIGVGQRQGRIHKEMGVLGNVWYLSSGYMKITKDTFAYEHPAMFPEKLAERHILTWSNPGDIVLDFFGGSGTTAKMARANGRRYLTCDISREYCDLMERRLSLPFTLPMLALMETGS